VYSSRDSAHCGVGYPSCSRSLALVPRNYHDPNEYYAELGIPPWASAAEIKTALRAAWRRFHPDGYDPDEDMFCRVSEIAEVLTDPVLKRRYDTTPEGEVFVDSRIRARMEEAGVPLSALSPFDDDSPPGESHFDYFSEGIDPYDCPLSQRWYAAFVEASPLVGYTSAIRVLLWDRQSPHWIPQAGIMCIPRTWPPNSAVALALMTVHANMVSAPLRA